MATSNEIITSYDVNVVITKQGDARIKEVIFGAPVRSVVEPDCSKFELDAQ